MTIGDSPNQAERQKSLIPGGWFAGRAPVRDIVLGGLGDALAWAYSLLMNVKAGTRRAGATGWLLDVDAFGFFGGSFLRKTGESDASWRTRYTNEIFRPRVTRAAIDQALFNLTGRHPRIFEPWNAGDCGSYDLGGLAYAGTDFVQAPAGFYDVFGAYDIGANSYDVISGASGNTSAGMGAWGSLEIPYQLFVTAYRPTGGGIPNASGTDVGVWGYDLGAFRYTDESEVDVAVPDSEILATVASTQAAGVTAWTAISN